MKTLKEKIEVMQAALVGEEIETYNVSGNWLITGKPNWDWARFDYRIKPKPLEFWVNVSPAGLVTICYAKQEAEDYNGRTIKMREVTNE